MSESNNLESLEIGDHVLVIARSTEYLKMNGKYGIIKQHADNKRSFAVEFFESIRILSAPSIGHEREHNAHDHHGELGDNV